MTPRNGLCRSDTRLSMIGLSRVSASQRPKAVFPVPGGPYRQILPARDVATPLARSARFSLALHSDGSNAPASTAPSRRDSGACPCALSTPRSEEHTYELQSLMRTSYAVFCLTQKRIKRHDNTYR